jgi:colanic acid biosynthesis glycosyl transferase WcaI
MTATRATPPKPCLIFLNRFFYPDHSATSQLLSDLAFELAARGHGVHVVTSRQLCDRPDEGLPSSEYIDGVSVHRVWTSRFGRHDLAGRVFDYLTFYLVAAWRLARLVRRGHIVIAMTDPPMLSVMATPIARLRGALLVNWLQDVFPEVAEGLGVGGQLAQFGYASLRGLRNHSLRRAAFNVVLGELMAARIASLGVASERIVIIPNWADGARIKPVASATNELRRTWGLDDRFVVGYSGNLGRAHEYATLLDAIQLVEQQASAGGCGVEWLFIGGGALMQHFQMEVARRGLRSVQFRPYQRRSELALSLSAADVHLVSLRPELEGLIVPSKVYGIAAAGRLVVFIGANDGEIARFIVRHECGRIVAQGDGAGLAQTVLELAGDPVACRRMGENARKAFDAEFDRSIAVGRWEALLDDTGALKNGLFER